MDAEQRSVFQGIVYYYRENMVNCRYQVTLKDAVDCALLQQALKTEGDTLRRQIVQPVFSDNWEHAEAFPLQNVRRIGYWRLYRCLDRPLVQQVLSTTSIGSRIQCSFLGNGLVLTVSFGWMAADYRWRVDGGAWTTERYDGWTTTPGCGLKHCCTV